MTWPSSAQAARELGVSKNTIRERIKRFKKLGWSKDGIGWYYIDDCREQILENYEELKK